MIKPFTLLVVDDDKHNRLLLAQLLQDDYRILLAKNGQQGFDRAREHLPDLILLDVLMPEMDGFSMIRLLKENDATRQIPVIFISSLDSVDNEALGLELGAVDYVAKPFSPSILRVRVRNHLQLVHQRRLLEELALIDSLTEIANRRRFVEHFEQEWRRCLRSMTTLSLMMIDVDHFKQFNDTYGHAAGDIVLKQVARTIRAELRRPADLVARYGGEEFVVVVPEIGVAGAQLLAEQIRASIEAQRIPHAEAAGAAWVTVSIGGATCTPNDAEASAELFCRADNALYEAKHAGRNRLVWADALPPAQR